MPVRKTSQDHFCPDAISGEVSQIHEDVSDHRWYWHIFGFRFPVCHCPHCGEKLEQPDA